MNDDAHFGRIAHILTSAKRSVLETLEECGRSDQDRIVECWRSRTPGMRPLVSQALPLMVSQTLWKLSNLELVDSDSVGLWGITLAGRDVLDA